MTAVGRVGEVWRYPVKSMGGELLRSAPFGPLGMLGDRGWALRDEAAGEIRGAKKLPALMRCQARYDAEPNGARIPPATMTLSDGTTLRTGDADANARLSGLVGRAVTLWPVQPADHRDHYRRAAPIRPILRPSCAASSAACPTSRCRISPACRRSCSSSPRRWAPTSMPFRCIS